VLKTFADEGRSFIGDADDLIHGLPVEPEIKFCPWMAGAIMIRPGCSTLDSLDVEPNQSAAT